MDPIETVLVTGPRGIRVGDLVFRETAYGVVKRLRFLVERIEEERRRMGLERHETRILDVGCGTGTYITIPLAEIGYEVEGIDADPATIERARQNARYAGVKDLVFHCGRLVESNPGLFQVVICSEVLELQPQPATFLRELRGVLVERGLLLLSVPNGYGYYELESWVCRRFPSLPARAIRVELAAIRTLGTPGLKRRHRVEYGGVSPEADRLRNSVEQSSLAADASHDQRFTPGQVRSLLAALGFEVLGFRNNTILAGNLVNALIRSLDPILYLNSRLADFTPSWMVADWLIAARKGSDPAEGTRSVGFSGEGGRRQSADLEQTFAVLRAKWSEVPAGSTRRAPTSRLLTLPDDELLAFHEDATRQATEGEGFGIRGWYHCLYRDILRGKKVMDVGSGLGIDGLAFAAAGASMTFVDIVETNLMALRRLCALKGIRNAAFCYLKDLSSLAALAKDYDVIWCQGSMINAPFEEMQAEAQALLHHLKAGGRWIELAYPKARWGREGRLPFDQWGDRTDGGAPWMEWYDLAKLKRRLAPAEFDTVLYFEFHNCDFNWFDLKRRI